MENIKNQFFGLTPPTCSEGPGLVLCHVELLLAAPLQSLDPLLVTQPVADVVNIPGVDQDLCR